jgi:Periplasmic component of the Tol biopolymer transport system
MTKFYPYFIVILFALGILALLRWNAVHRYSSFVDDRSNEFIVPEEKPFKILRQLTFSGENAEAYFSSDSKKLIFPSHDGDGKCDQIYTLVLKTGTIEMVSTGDGVTTCSFFVYP